MTVPWIDAMYYGNTLQTWVIALAVAAGVLTVLWLLRRWLHATLAARAARTRTDVDDLVADLLGRTRLFFLLAAALYAASLTLALPPRPAGLLGALAGLAALFQIAVWGNGIIAYAINRYVRRQVAEDAAVATTVSAFGFLARLALWVLIVFIALDNLGVDITALIAGLGVGGIAVALAVQNILSDLFASFSIVLDKPFVIGDFIVVGDQPGTVEHIGLKTTRVRSLWGEQVVFSNSDLLSSRVRNFKRLVERRILFTVGVTYQTPAGKVAQIPEILRGAVQSQPDARFDRAHFKAFGDFALQFEIVYYVTNPDYTVYMNVQQAINLEIYRRFQEARIEFAYPTQTLYVAGGSLAAAN